MSEATQKAYVAGIIDGEGTITLTRLYKNARWKTPIVSVSSTTQEILEFLRGLYGGPIVKHKTYQPHHKQSWSWRLERRRAIQLCEDILPFLLEPEKRYRAALLVQEYVEVTPRNGHYSQKMCAAKEDFEYRFFHPGSP